jgi:hypothetical protein
MVEAKSSKLREYFTETTHHTHIMPSDESGKKIFVGDVRCDQARKRESPIRLNDTFRSNVVLGFDEAILSSNATPPIR